MSLRRRLREAGKGRSGKRLYEKFGILTNPFPASNQTFDNPHYELPADEQAERRIVAFLRDQKSQAMVVEGTQGVGKTNFLNHFESEIRDVLDVLDDRKGYYVVRYLADPEASFEGTTRRLFEELGTDHLVRLIESLRGDSSPIEAARNPDMRTALYHLIESDDGSALELMMQWLLGLRLLKVHRQALGVQFKLDTVESKTVALRDMVQVSGRAGVLNGIFLLLDELEKQGGVLGPTAIVRYLSALRAVVDALPQRLFLMIAITPDALIRYSSTLPALRGRLQNTIALEPLMDVDDAVELAKFYLHTASRKARKASSDRDHEFEWILEKQDVVKCYEKLEKRAERRGDTGVRQREFLHELHVLAEDVIQGNA